MRNAEGVLANKVALITGAASGIGAAAADLFEQEGAKVWRADLADSTPLVLDVTDAASWKAALDRILAVSGRLDVLVNAAGVAGGSEAATVETVSLAHWRQVFAVNLEGTLLGCQQAMRSMRNDAPSAIVNIASTAAVAPSPALAAYGASKAGVVQLTRSVAAACASAGRSIRCNCVLPGMVATPMTTDMAPAYREAWLGQIPQGRFANPIEIANTILFLASDHASYINGTALSVDGGMLSRPIVAPARRLNL
ncbi:SDR family NAD(P)-dependent oxidoreductase [Sphingomonas koreensis]|jgi:3(or 17)beta-hydroxysteroid dehydrogenase|uniref:SDR family oxidoreductase n=1 Tax=Sphingomonas koreensis TaxID=93064 RepID=A0A1L6J5B7_9SPHN|nr:SDR family oxidoreductase [Sphingomonas koreensis]APR51142.1 hypothetical protein BRX40_00695 [Sphingomonas koreensis]MDC7810558.1 SDR family oxidoreductase [Sphingomonas koreensis]RSU17767.1 SDR family NAD(P)-dependent oxidoreductase [Sphingomonas koreensis]RSU21995.1 SDR family NAD(P)-dependent oxidoreductase [Sphingomonas koreensis]RSU23139.1 SDR family NAD(P)-dependent oxidoreductase [Sphingomonas koreensis]